MYEKTLDPTYEENMNKFNDDFDMSLVLLDSESDQSQMNIDQYLQSLNKSGLGFGRSVDQRLEIDQVNKAMYMDKEYLQHLSLPLFRRRSLEGK